MSASAISACAIPAGSLLNAYQRDGGHADCFMTDVAKRVSHAQYVEAFYTSSLFKVERLILKWAISKPSNDRQARELASGENDSFAAWRVERRSDNQLLLAAGRTRSWLMAVPAADREEITRLYFGSAVVPRTRAESGESGLGFAFSALLGFHKLYSRALLRAARSRLENSVT